MLRIAGLAVAVLGLKAAAPVASPVDPHLAVGVVGQVTGDVTLRRAAKGEAAKPARVGYALHPGDRLALAKGATVTVVLPSQCESVAASGQDVVATADGVKAAVGTLVRTRLEPCLGASHITAEADSTMRAGATVLRAAPDAVEVLEPADLKVCTERPRIRYRTIADLSKVPFTIVDASGATVLAGDVPVEAREAEYPPSAAPLVAGTHYRIRTFAIANDEGNGPKGTFVRVGDTDAPFSVATAEELAAVRKALGPGGAPTLLAAMYADDAGCYAEALRFYRASAGKDPPENVSVRVKWLEGVLGD